MRLLRGCPSGADGIKDLLPDTVTSASAREAANERTSDLPSFKNVGDSLKNTLGTSSDPKDIGRAIDNNTPGAQCAGCAWAGQVCKKAWRWALLVKRKICLCVTLTWCCNAWTAWHVACVHQGHCCMRACKQRIVPGGTQASGWDRADGPDLTKNPKDLADDAKAGVSKLVRQQRQSGCKGSMDTNKVMSCLASPAFVLPCVLWSHLAWAVCHRHSASKAA